MATTQNKQFLKNGMPLTDIQKMSLLLTGKISMGTARSRSTGASTCILPCNDLDKSTINTVEQLVVSSFKQKNGRRKAARIITKKWRKGRVNTLNRLRKKIGKKPI